MPFSPNAQKGIKEMVENVCTSKSVAKTNCKLVSRVMISEIITRVFKVISHSDSFVQYIMLKKGLFD